MIQLKDRTAQSRGTWEEVYRNARRADRIRNELHERDEGELERTGQPLTIYEPYFGEGTWPFLHHTSLYRGLGLVIYMVTLPLIKIITFVCGFFFSLHSSLSGLFDKENYSIFVVFCIL